MIGTRNRETTVPLPVYASYAALGADTRGVAAHSTPGVLGTVHEHTVNIWGNLFSMHTLVLVLVPVLAHTHRHTIHTICIKTQTHR